MESRVAEFIVWYKFAEFRTGEFALDVGLLDELVGVVGVEWQLQ